MALKTITTDHLTWIDIDQPTEADITQLSTLIDIHPLAIEEFATPTVRARATQYHNGIFLAIHIPLFDKKERATYPAELDIILTETQIVTGHTHEIYQLDTFFDDFAKNRTLQTNHVGAGPAYLLHAILDMMLNSCFPRLEHITKNIDAIESGVFHGDAKRMVEEISIVKRDILNFRRTMMPQRSIIESLIHKEERFVPRNLHIYIRDLIGTNTRIWNILESHKETTESLEDTNDTLLSHRLNEKMSILTLVSVITLPATLYASILGINTFVPLQNHPYGFLIHIGVMIAMVLITAGFFKWRNWI